MTHVGTGGSIRDYKLDSSVKIFYRGNMFCYYQRFALWFDKVLLGRSRNKYLKPTRIGWVLYCGFERVVEIIHDNS